MSIVKENRRTKKSERAKALKAAKSSVAFAKLNNCPTSPRKMRLVADMIRGIEVNKALALLKYSKKEASGRLETLLLSALDNWQKKNDGQRVEDVTLVVKSINVDSARVLKRLQTAPQGRAHRIRKRSNHVTLEVGTAEA
ncbi:MAG: 50S ribosomal protein L22 [Flavobacteriales bacterium]|jgi:large subunit ribosomal protein L22|nr:50S ribosomal protein L22 [Flavobacteriales bacterium]